MKRRELKKVINDISGELFTECVFALHYKCVQNKEDVDNVMKNIILLRQDLIARISHVEPGSVKLFFRKLKLDLTSSCEEIEDQIKEIV